MESGFGWACEYGRNDVVDFLLDRGADLCAGESTNQTGLHWAVIGGELETVNLLLKRGAPVEARSVDGGTVLGQATWCVINGDHSVDYVPIIRALLAAGTRIEEADYPTGNERVDELLRRGLRPWRPTCWCRRASQILWSLKNAVSPRSL